MNTATLGSERVRPPVRWLFLLYGSVALPDIGAGIIILASTIAYYRLWRRQPALASAINRHCWYAVALNVVANLCSNLWFPRSH